MKQKATRHHIKNHNTQLVLKTIFEADSISRADIARVTKLTRPTVSSLISELLEEQLITETGMGPSAGGKPPMLLEVDANARLLACIDIGNQLFRGALINLRGEIVVRVERLAAGQTGEAAVQIVHELLDELLPRQTIPLLGIGIGTPGIVDPIEGIVQESVNLDWHGLPLRERLQVHYNAPIYLDNDSRVAALAEYKFGAVANQNLILIKTGQGIGAGIILQGQPYYGDSFSAGEIGQIVVARENGRSYSLESLAGTRGMLRQAQVMVDSDLTWERFTTAVFEGDAQLTEIFIEAGQRLGTAVGDLIAAYNIHHIVFSGRVIDFGDLFEEIVFTTAQQRVSVPLAAKINFSCSTLGADIVLLGCSALIMKEELGVI